MAEKPNNDNAAADVASAKNTSSCQLEASNAERHVWLMKCPPIVSRAMQNNHLPPPPPCSADGAKDPITNSGPTVSKVTISVDPLLPNNDFSSTQYAMELGGNTHGNIPKCYSMNMSTDFVPMSVFSESSHDEVVTLSICAENRQRSKFQGELSVEGKVYHKFNMRPHDENIEDYEKLFRERNNKYMATTRKTQTSTFALQFIDGKHMKPIPKTVDSKPSGPADREKMPEKELKMRRTRKDPEEMEQILLKLFERQPKWTLKQLILETDQPEQFLKEMLKLLCVYNYKGADQGTYEIKPEYKISQDKSEYKISEDKSDSQ
ncbi:Transcription initiation factor IIF [Forsythia ovata]|uniref:Transcription initiation factor IIF n=1 Tax=Forsythia ovata TaxID=205694 RepID=A0ABD1X0T4_9LAMI